MSNDDLGDDVGDEPVPHTDPTPAEGPGGPDAVPDWEAAGPDPVTPDQPRSAQVEDKDVPDEISEPEQMDDSDADGKETLTEPGEDPDEQTTA